MKVAFSTLIIAQLSVRRNSTIKKKGAPMMAVRIEMHSEADRDRASVSMTIMSADEQLAARG